MNTEQLNKGVLLTNKIKRLENHLFELKVQIAKHYKEEENQCANSVLIVRIHDSNSDYRTPLETECLPMDISTFMRTYILLLQQEIEKVKKEFQQL
jgi:hypothetical protein